MIKCLKKERDEMSESDALIVFIMSHGIPDHVLGTDERPVKIDDITEIFDGNNCELLRDKPKIFFIQACQGSE